MHRQSLAALAGAVQVAVADESACCWLRPRAEADRPAPSRASLPTARPPDRIPHDDAAEPLSSGTRVAIRIWRAACHPLRFSHVGRLIVNAGVPILTLLPYPSLRGAQRHPSLRGAQRHPSLRGAQRRSNRPPGEPRTARQAGDCLVAALLAMTGRIGQPTSESRTLGRALRIGQCQHRSHQPVAATSSTCSAIASDAVRPGDSMPNRLISPGTPWVCGPCTTKSCAGAPRGTIFGRMPA